MSAKTSAGTAATMTGSTINVLPPHRSCTQPTISAATAAAAIAAAYTTGTAAVGTSSAFTRW